MAVLLDAGAPDFEARFRDLLAQKRETAEDVDAAVRGIVADVRARGDAALCDFTRKFDRFDVTPARLRSAWPTSTSLAALPTIGVPTAKASSARRDRLSFGEGTTAASAPASPSHLSASLTRPSIRTPSARTSMLASPASTRVGASGIAARRRRYPSSSPGIPFPRSTRPTYSR